MEAAKRRDSRKCRWPHWSAEERETCRILGIACAHLNHRGMGGDKKLVRTRKDRLITFSIRCHDRFDGRLGPPNRRVVFLTEQGTDGPCAFEEKRSGQWEEIGREVSIGVLMRGSRTATLKE